MSAAAGAALLLSPSSVLSHKMLFSAALTVAIMLAPSSQCFSINNDATMAVDFLCKYTFYCIMGAMNAHM